MKIRAPRAELADTLAWVTQALSKRPASPELGGVRLTAAGDTLTLAAFDYDIAHTAVVDVDGASEGECLVSGQFLREIVSSMRGDVVELVHEDRHLSVSAGRSTYRTQVLALEAYPALPEQPAAVGEISAGSLQSLVSAVRFPIDDGSPYPQVRGLHLEGDGTDLTAVGASQFMIAEATLRWSRRSDLKVTVPVRAVEAALKGLRGEVTIGHEGGMFGLSDGVRSIAIRTYDQDEFTQWRRLMRPVAQDAMTCSVDLDDLRDSIKRAGMLADDAIPIVLTFGPEGLSITVTGEHGSTGGSEAVAAQCDGDLELGVNSRYLLDALSAIPGGGVIDIGLLGKSKPLALRPVDHTHVLAIIQPKPVPGGAA